jgi:hypothetical protein
MASPANIEAIKKGYIAVVSYGKDFGCGEDMRGSYIVNNII